MMFSQEQMEEWEARAVPLDERGESEAYFPLWGIVDVDDYLQKSDASRAERQQAAALKDAGAEAANDCGEGASAEGGSGAAAVGAGGAAAVRPSAGARVAWGAWFWVKRVGIALVVCVVGSMLVTMALNPAMTFFDAANALFGGVASLIEKVFG